MYAENHLVGFMHIADKFPFFEHPDDISFLQGLYWADALTPWIRAIFSDIYRLETGEATKIRKLINTLVSQDHTGLLPFMTTEVFGVSVSGSSSGSALSVD